jgi:hypothetical protein
MRSCNSVNATGVDAASRKSAVPLLTSRARSRLSQAGLAKALRSERLGEKVECAVLHRPDGHVHVAMASDQYHEQGQQAE